MIEKTPFRITSTKKKDDTFTVWLNEDDRKMLDAAKINLEQAKDSTALKILARIGAKRLGSQEIEYILSEIYSNKRKNKRIGIQEFV